MVGRSDPPRRRLTIDAVFDLTPCLIGNIPFSFFSVPKNPPAASLSSRRQLKAAEAIREVVASAIVTEIRDPRVQGVTVVGVKVTADMREAKVMVSVMGDQKQESLSLHGLRNSAGFLQQKIANRIDTKNTPRLSFEVDKGLQNSMTVNEILERIRREKEADEAAKSGRGDSGGGGGDSVAGQDDSQGDAVPGGDPAAGDLAARDPAAGDPAAGDSAFDDNSAVGDSPTDDDPAAPPNI